MIRTPSGDLPPLDAVTALRLLTQVVTDIGPDHRYSEDRIRYTLNGRPACLIGHVLYRYGVPLPDLTELDRRMTVPELPAGLLTLHAEQILDVAQQTQDEGHPWGVALRDARMKAQQLGVKDPQ